MLTKNQALRVAENIHGWCPPEELSFLYDTAAALPPHGVWVEVGCFKGRSLAAAALAAQPSRQVIAVDPFEGHPRSPTQSDCRLGTWVLDHVRALSRLSLRYGGPPITILQVRAAEALRDLRHSRVDVAYLDPDWREGLDAVKDVLRAWAAVVKPGGMLMGRNYGIEHRIGGIEDAPDCLGTVERPAGTLWVWRRPT